MTDPVSLQELRETLDESVRDHLLGRLAYHGEYGTTTHEQHIFDAETDFARELNDGALVDVVLAVLSEAGWGPTRDVWPDLYATRRSSPE